MAPSVPVPGIMWVNSDVIKPTELSRQDFDTWYCDEHIPDVMKKSGISSAARYVYVEDGSTPNRKLKFLTLYGMPDINYMHTDDFKNLEGQKEGPSRERIFEKSEFDTRTYKAIQSKESESAGAGPAEWLLCATMNHKNDELLDEWYRKEHVEEISKCPGHRRTSRYTIATRSILSEFVRTIPEQHKWMALHEFDAKVPWTELAATDATDWAKKIIPGITAIDFGLFKLVRVYRKAASSKI